VASVLAMPLRTFHFHGEAHAGKHRLHHRHLGLHLRDFSRDFSSACAVIAAPSSCRPPDW
jgi:hypothetical protein